MNFTTCMLFSDVHNPQKYQNFTSKYLRLLLFIKDSILTKLLWMKSQKTRKFSINNSFLALYIAHNAQVIFSIPERPNRWIPTTSYTFTMGALCSEKFKPKKPDILWKLMEILWVTPAGRCRKNREEKKYTSLNTIWSRGRLWATNGRGIFKPVRRRSVVKVVSFYGRPWGCKTEWYSWCGEA